MSMRRVYSLVVGLVLLLVLIWVGGGESLAQTTSVISVDSSGVKTYLIQFPDGNPADQYAYGDDELRSILTNYGVSVANNAVNQAGSSGNNNSGLGATIGNFANSTWNGIKDDIDREIQGILQEGVEDIMNGIKDQLMNYVMSLLDSTPITEVNSMKRLLKDAYSKQQKVQYQDYKVEYAEMKSQTELSSGFVKYYNALDLRKQLEGFSTQVENSRKLAGTRFFSSGQKQASRQVLDRIGDTDALVEDVKTACNLNQGTVYMSEADRVKVLEAARADIRQRQTQLASLNQFLSKVYSARVSAYQRQEQTRSMYAPGSVLNRSIFAEDVKLTP